jgi:hypothetical protein
LNPVSKPPQMMTGDRAAGKEDRVTYEGQAEDVLPISTH